MKINRIEIIDHTRTLEEGGGRCFVKWTEKDFDVAMDVQDQGATLKIFITNEESQQSQ